MLAGMDRARGEGEAVVRASVMDVSLKWLMRSMRVMRPTNFSPSSTMATSLRSNIGAQRFQLVGRPARCAASPSSRSYTDRWNRCGAVRVVAFDVAQDVALVEDADDAVVLRAPAAARRRPRACGCRR